MPLGVVWGDLGNWVPLGKLVTIGVDGYHWGKLGTKGEAQGTNRWKLCTIGKLNGYHWKVKWVPLGKLNGYHWGSWVYRSIP